MSIFVLTLLSATAAAANASAPEQPAISQLPNGEIVFRDYPERARAAGEQGLIEFRIRADATGLPITCEITRSSGFSSLDEETCYLLRYHAHFQPVGKNPEKVLHQGRVRWTLPAAPPELATRTIRLTPPAVAKQPALVKPPAAVKPVASVRAPAPGKSESVKDAKVVCKRVPRTDTITGTERVCRRVQAGQK